MTTVAAMTYVANSGFWRVSLSITLPVLRLSETPERFVELGLRLGAVEVIGDSQTHSDLAGEALEYLTAGGKLVWVVDPERARVVVYTRPDHVRVVSSAEVLDGGEALPGFSCSASEFFEWPTCRPSYRRTRSS